MIETLGGARGRKLALGVDVGVAESVLAQTGTIVESHLLVLHEIDFQSLLPVGVVVLNH